MKTFYKILNLCQPIILVLIFYNFLKLTAVGISLSNFNYREIYLSKLIILIIVLLITFFITEIIIFFMSNKKYKISYIKFIISTTLLLILIWNFNIALSFILLALIILILNIYRILKVKELLHKTLL